MKDFFIILATFILGFFSDYINHHEINIESQNNHIQTVNGIQNFNFEQVKNIDGLELYSTPDLKVLDKIISKIDNAKNYVYLEVYILTEKNIQKALKRAKDRGVDVKVILEKNVYMASYLNKKSFNNLSDAGINIVWSDDEDYALNHTKMMLIDDKAIISTGNYSHSSFKNNREFFLFFSDENLIEKLKKIFNNDFLGNKYEIYSDNLLLSPYYSKEKFKYLINNAKKSIKIYSLNFSSEYIKNLLMKRKNDGIDIQIIFPSLEKVESNKEIIESFNSYGIKTKLLKSPNLHAKAILIDEKILYLGSINFSDYSMEKNREIGLIINNLDIIKSFLNIFKNDFDN